MYGQSARLAAAAEPDFVLTRLRPLLGLTLTLRRWFDTKGLPLPGGPDREADLIAIADEPEPGKAPWLLIFEIQSQHDEQKPKVLQLEAMIFLVYSRDVDRGGGEMLPLPVFVYLKGECPGGGVVTVRTPTGYGYSGKPVAWELARDSAPASLAKVESGEFSWGAMFWISLMAGADEPPVIDWWRRLLDEKVPPKHRADVAFVASQFAELAGRWVAWNRVIGEAVMTESAIANRMIEIGQMKQARADLTEFVKGRFPEVLTPDVERAIADQPSLPLLREWVAAAGRARTADDFLAVLRR